MHLRPHARMHAPTYTWTHSRLHTAHTHNTKVTCINKTTDVKSYEWSSFSFLKAPIKRSQHLLGADVEAIWHPHLNNVEKSFISFKLCFNIFSTFILFSKCWSRLTLFSVPDLTHLTCWEIVEAVWHGMVSTSLKTNFETVGSGLKWRSLMFSWREFRPYMYLEPW